MFNILLSKNILSICEEIDRKFISDINKYDNIFGVGERGTADNNDEQGINFTNVGSVNITQLLEEHLKHQSFNKSDADLFLVLRISTDDLFNYAVILSNEFFIERFISQFNRNVLL